MYQLTETGVNRGGLLPLPPGLQSAARGLTLYGRRACSCNRGAGDAGTVGQVNVMGVSIPTWLAAGAAVLVVVSLMGRKK